MVNVLLTIFPIEDTVVYICVWMEDSAHELVHAQIGRMMRWSNPNRTEKDVFSRGFANIFYLYI